MPRFFAPSAIQVPTTAIEFPANSSKLKGSRSTAPGAWATPPPYTPRTAPRTADTASSRSPPPMRLPSRGRPRDAGQAPPGRYPVTTSFPDVLPETFGFRPRFVPQEADNRGPVGRTGFPLIPLCFSMRIPPQRPGRKPSGISCLCKKAPRSISLGPLLFYTPPAASTNARTVASAFLLATSFPVSRRVMVCL